LKSKKKGENMTNASTIAFEETYENQILTFVDSNLKHNSKVKS